MNSSLEHVGPIVIRGQVVTAEEVLDDGVVVLEGERIAWVGAFRAAARTPWAQQVGEAPAPADGTIVLPGLVDLHNHGGGGASFPDAKDAATAQLAIDEHRRHGTTHLVASLVTASPDTLRARVSLLTHLAEEGELAGIHLEGPFLATARCGAHDPALILAPDPALTAELLELGRGHVVTMTIAPERAGITGDDGVTAALVAGGALPSFGHTDASSPQMHAALDDAGAHLAGPRARSERATVTHLFNGMRPIHHREPGPVPPALARARDGRLVLELIADGTHLAPELVTDLFALVGAENIALVTDAMAAAGMPDGDYRLGSQEVRVRGGVARLAHADSIAGGTAHLIDVVRTTVQAGVPLREAVLAASLTPAGVLGRERIGALRVGYRADVVVTDADLWVQQVIRGGRPVH